MSEALLPATVVAALPDRADVAVIGGGILGLSLALELARRGADTIVLERGDCAGRATSALGAAAGMVNPQAHPGVEPEPVRELSLLSRGLYGDWIASIEEESGLACEYDSRGGFTAALSEEQEVALDRALDWQRVRGLPFEVLSGEEAREREPLLGPDVRAAFSFPNEGHLSPPCLGRALAAAARAVGVRVVERCPVRRIVVEGGNATAVEAGTGRVRAGAIVNAAGAWAAHLAGVPPAPVEPLRGQLVLLDASGLGQRLSRFVFVPGVYVVPRRDGGVVIGSTVERAGFDARPTAEGVAGLLARAVRVMPALAGCAVDDVWAGLRPGSPDGIPLIGETSVAGYFLATSHFKNGILLAPASAVLMADLLTHEKPLLPPGPFSPARFGL